MTQTLRIATRKSPLALWQAEFVKASLMAVHPALSVEIVSMTTKGDNIKDSKLLAHGGKGLFIKELEQALMEDRADIAVHSMKDVTVEFPEGLILPVICEREDPRDVFVSNHYLTLEQLPPYAIVGTSSLRRQSQLRAARPDLNMLDLRGNVNTRLGKLDTDEFDGLILAAAGLKRLGLGDRIREYLNVDLCLPAIGQGALGIECRENDKKTQALIAPLNHEPTAICLKAERVMNEMVGGGCRLPIAAHATLDQKTLTITGRVGRPDGTLILSSEAEGPVKDSEKLGEKVAKDLLEQGADDIIQELLP